MLVKSLHSFLSFKITITLLTLGQCEAFTYSPLQMYDKRTISKHFPSELGLTTETSALKLFTVANLCYQLSR